jgi:hypothetical protein
VGFQNCCEDDEGELLGRLLAGVIGQPHGEGVGSCPAAEEEVLREGLADSSRAQCQRGGSYTSSGYIQSPQSALDKARA